MKLSSFLCPFRRAHDLGLEDEEQHLDRDGHEYRRGELKSTDSEGYWPLSYHGGSVWTHDTAIAIAGLAREGFAEEAGRLVSGLLAAASGFEYRMPELHSGDPASRLAVPVPYPAACRPQAWSAAAAVSVLGSVLGLEPDAQAGILRMSPSGAVGLLTVSGIRFAGSEVPVRVTAEGEVAAVSGAVVEVR